MPLQVQFRMSDSARFSAYATPANAMLAIAFQAVALGTFLLLVLESELTSSAFISPLARKAVITRLGGHLRELPSGEELSLPLLGIVGLTLLGLLVLNGLPWLLRRWRGTGSGRQICLDTLKLAGWLSLLLVWSGCWLFGTGFEAVTILAAATVNLLAAVVFAGWGTLLFAASRSNNWQPQLVSVDATVEHRARYWVAGGILTYVVCFVFMNWGLWFNLRIPHGDSAMYEEHLWNVLNGKGFRSYLDQGLFLGEHIQVIHLFLLPIYYFWPSHLLLELAESLALAMGAIPTYFIARRHTGQPAAAALLAGAYLLYVPLHYLDIAIDFKTFRPIAFGVPLLLWGIDALERRRWGEVVVATLLTLACKEDYAIVLAPLGVWFAWVGWRDPSRSSHEKRREVVRALTLAVSTTVYLLFVVKIAIPWFRNWETVHYARYFEQFGSTPTEIVLSMLIRPQLLLKELLRLGALLYFLRLLVPLGGLMRRALPLLVGLPLFVLLCLNTISMQSPGPYHHFHAPLVPILIWSACVAIGKKSNRAAHEGHTSSTIPEELLVRKLAEWCFCCAFITSVLLGFHPFSVSFWDSGDRMYWKRIYLPDDRARNFAAVLEQLPADARVASTDYVHARMTHFKRSYDFSDYPRAVANYEPRVPDDTDYIILDLQHEYSLGKYEDLSRVPLLQDQLEQWEELPDRTQGYFKILRRRTQNHDKLSAD